MLQRFVWKKLFLLIKIADRVLVEVKIFFNVLVFVIAARLFWSGIGKYFRDNHKNYFGHQKYFRIKMFSRRCTYSLQSWQSRKIHQTWYFLSNSSWGGQSKIAERIFEQFYPNQMSTRTPSCRSRSDHWTELTVVCNCRWIQRLYAW